MLTLTTPPMGEPLLLPDVKLFLRIDHDADDTLIASMIRTARSFVERRLDIALLRQNWTVSLDCVPTGPITIRPGKVDAIQTATVTYGDDEPRLLEAEQLRLVRSVPAKLVFDLDLAHGEGGITSIDVTFSTGWTTIDDVPEDLRHAVMLLVAHYYEERELFAAGRYVPVPHGLQTHIEAFREVRL